MEWFDWFDTPKPLKLLLLWLSTIASSFSVLAHYYKITYLNIHVMWWQKFHIVWMVRQQSRNHRDQLSNREIVNRRLTNTNLLSYWRIPTCIYMYIYQERNYGKSCNQVTFDDSDMVDQSYCRFWQQNNNGDYVFKQLSNWGYVGYKSEWQCC